MAEDFSCAQLSCSMRHCKTSKDSNPLVVTTTRAHVVITRSANLVPLLEDHNRVPETFVQVSFLGVSLELLVMALQQNP